MIAADLRTNRFENEIEDQAILMIARRQPLAVDLRQTVTAIRVAADLERIGDLAKNIAKRAASINDEPGRSRQPSASSTSRRSRSNS